MKDKANNKGHVHARILDVAQALFARFGFKKTAMDEVARVVRVSKATLYLHFPEGKEELFAHVVRRESCVLLNDLKHAVEHAATSASKVRAFFVVRMGRMKQLANLNDVSEEALQELFPLAETVRQDFFRQEQELLENVLVKGRRAGDFDLAKPKLVAFALLAAVQGIDVVSLRTRHSPDLAKGMDQMLDLLLRALEPRSAE